MDDSLSAVDTDTEENILKNLKETRKGKTTILIAHRISTTQNADYILVLEEEIDEIERQLQEGHVERLTRGECDAETGMIFTDVVSNIERVADHATNIAFSIMTDVKKPDLTD